MLILESGFSEISWSVIEDSKLFDRGNAPFHDAEIPEQIQKLVAHASQIAYHLVNGADVFLNPVTRLEPGDLIRLEKVIPLFPLANRVTYALAENGLRLRPNIDHYLLCETAFFHDMPLKTSAFALPFAYLEKGVRRFGGDGLFHQWAWEAADQRIDRLQRLVSVHLGDAPNMAAILNGHALESSLGFSPLDGIPSRTGCGEIDPGIVLLFAEQGMPPEKIEQVLAQDSGLCALLGRQAHWEEAAAGGAPQFYLAHQLLLNQVIKTIGAGMAALGGADAVLFGYEPASQWSGFIREVCLKLQFAGVDQTGRDAGQKTGRFTGAHSRVQVLGLEYPRALSIVKLLEENNYA
jgi:acetate kinase